MDVFAGVAVLTTDGYALGRKGGVGGGNGEVGYVLSSLRDAITGITGRRPYIEASLVSSRECVWYKCRRR